MPEFVEKLIHDIERYLRKTGMSQTAFGTKVMGDPNFVARLKEGKNPQARTVDKVRKFLDDNR